MADEDHGAALLEVLREGLSFDGESRDYRVSREALDHAEALIARAEKAEADRDEYRRRAESYAAERPWTGRVLNLIIEADEHEPAGVIVDFETSDGPSELWLPLADIPEESRAPGSLCRIEWSREKWTSDEIERARAAAEKLHAVLSEEPEE